MSVSTNAVHNALLTSLKTAAGPLVAAVHASKTGTDAWYQASYSIFTGAPLTPADFLKVVAYAYSWVATIPHADPRSSFGAVKTAIANLQKAEHAPSYNVQAVRKARENVVQEVKKALGISGTSVVIVSKVLHFWDPSLAPMIDVNVSRGWKKLAGADKTWTKALKDSGNAKIDTLSGLPSTEQYLSYWELAYQFRLLPGVLLYRDLDQLMFCYGHE